MLYSLNVIFNVFYFYVCEKSVFFGLNIQNHNEIHRSEDK